MNEIKRWFYSELYNEIRQESHGKYVLHSDHEAEVALLRAEVEVGEKNLAAAMDQLAESDSENARLEAEVEKYRKDAMRYRWLTDPNFGRLSISDLFNAWWRSENGHPETINDAIDLAMKQDDAAMGASA